MTTFFKKLATGVVLTTGAYFGSVVPHTIFLPQYRDFVTRYRAGVPVPVSRRNEELIQEVMDDLKLAPKTRKLLKPFSLMGLNISHAGTFVTPYGSVIGIPIQYDYTDKESVDKSSIIITDDPIDFSTVEGKMFLDSLILSKNAKKFGIAHEILKLLENEPYHVAFGAAYVTGLFYTMYAVISRVFKFHTYRPLNRFAMANVTIVCAIASWFGYKDWIRYNNDVKIHNTLRQLGPDYIAGGKEFYEKLIEKNKALRILLSHMGPFFYKQNGDNNNFYLHRKEFHITDRLQLFDNVLNTGLHDA